MAGGQESDAHEATQVKAAKSRFYRPGVYHSTVVIIEYRPLPMISAERRLDGEVDGWGYVVSGSIQ